MAAPASAPPVLQIHPRDNVGVATHPLTAGTVIAAGPVCFTLAQDVGLGAKLALTALPAGAKILKYGEPIGTLTAAVPAGGYIHTHNLESDYLPTPARGDLVPESAP